MNVSAQNATQSDASEQSDNSGADDTGAEQQVTPRMAAMEAIAAQRRTALAADGVDTSGMDESEIPHPVADADEDVDNDIAEEGVQLAAQLVEDERPSSAPDNMRVKVKVDGEEIDLPLSEVIKSYQKDATASRRMTEATRQLAEATRLREIAEQQAISIAKNPDQENNEISNSDAAISKTDKSAKISQIRGAASKLYEGDEEGFAEGIYALVEQLGAKPATQQSIDPASVVAQVRQQLAVESAYGEVQSDYPEVFADDERGVVLGKAAYERKMEKEAAGVHPTRAIREAVEEVASLFGIAKQPGRQQAEPVRTARDTKLERKANLDNPDSANVVAGRKQAPAEAPNVSSVIAEMAKGRLGQSMPRS